MSRSDWVQHVAIGGGIALGLFLFLIVMNWAGGGLPDYDSRQYHNASHNECQAKLRSLGYLKPTNRKEGGSQSTNDPNYDDLCQQIRMAEAAVDAAESSRQQFLVGLLNLVLLIATTTAAGAAAKFAYDAAIATRDQADIAQETFQATTRAWVRVELSPAEDKAYHRFQEMDYILPSCITLTNVGSTPAHANVHIRCFSTFELPQTQTWIEQCSRRDDDVRVLMPNDPEKIHPEIEVKRGQFTLLPSAVEGETTPGSLSTWVVVCVTYRANRTIEGKTAVRQLAYVDLQKMFEREEFSTTHPWFIGGRERTSHAS